MLMFMDQSGERAEEERDLDIEACLHPTHRVHPECTEMEKQAVVRIIELSKHVHDKSYAIRCAKEASTKSLLFDLLKIVLASTHCFGQTMGKKWSSMTGYGGAKYIGTNDGGRGGSRGKSRGRGATKGEATKRFTSSERRDFVEEMVEKAKKVEEEDEEENEEAQPRARTRISRYQRMINDQEQEQERKRMEAKSKAKAVAARKKEEHRLTAIGMGEGKSVEGAEVYRLGQFVWDGMKWSERLGSLVMTEDDCSTLVTSARP